MAKRYRITLPQDVRIPNSKYILEKGETITIIPKASFNEDMDPSVKSEYDSAARWCAQRGYKGQKGDPLPSMLSAKVYQAINADPEAFQQRVTEMGATTESTLKDRIRDKVKVKIAQKLGLKESSALYARVSINGMHSVEEARQVVSSWAPSILGVDVSPWNVAEAFNGSIGRYDTYIALASNPMSPAQAQAALAKGKTAYNGSYYPIKGAEFPVSASSRILLFFQDGGTGSIVNV